MEDDQNKENEQDKKEEEPLPEINNKLENKNEEHKVEESKEENNKEELIDNKEIIIENNKENKIEESNINKIIENKEEQMENNENNNEPNKEINENIDDNNLLKISKIYIDKTSEFNGKTLYHIKGDFIPNESQVIRRYRDFDTLHLKLIKNWPGIIIPPIAQKKYFSSSTDQKVVNERIYQLENFLKISSGTPYLLEDEEFQLFLDPKITDSDNYQNLMKKIPDYSLKKISENYTKYFSEYKDLKKEEINEEKIQFFLDYTNLFIEKFNEYKKQVVQFGDIPKNKIYRETRIIKHFIEFEKFGITNVINNDLSLLYFFNNNSALVEDQVRYDKTVNQPYLFLSCWIRLKELELLSLKDKINEFKELWNKRITYNNKLKELNQKVKDINDGKVGFFEKIFVKGDTQKLKEKYANELKAHQEDTESINNIVTILSDYFSVEFYKYFQYLTHNFYNVVKSFASIQKENSILAMDLWLKVKNEKEDDSQKLNDIFNDKDNKDNMQNKEEIIEKKDN